MSDTELMNKYTIPNTDLEVSRIAFGTWHLGGSWDSTPLSAALKTRAVNLLNEAVDQGITHIDLADIYTRGKSDEAIGHALAQSPGLRDKLVLQEKSGIVLNNEPNAGDPPRYDFSYDNIVGKVERSLRRLGTDRLDLLALHRPDPLVEYEEVARAIDHLHQSGKVRYFGVSNHNWAQIDLLKQFVDQPLVVNQVELNLLHHHLIANGILVNQTGGDYDRTIGTMEYCRAHDIMIQAWSPVAGGRLFKQEETTPENEQSVARLLIEMADKHATTPEAIAVAWLLRHPAKIQPIIGTRTVSRIGRTVAADTVTLSRIEWYALLAAARGAGVP